MSVTYPALHAFAKNAGSLCETEQGDFCVSGIELSELSVNLRQLDVDSAEYEGWLFFFCFTLVGDRGPGAEERVPSR